MGKPAAAKTEPEKEDNVEEAAEVKPKRGRKAAASKTEAEAVSQVEETKPKRGRKPAARTVEETVEVPAVSPVKPRGRAAAKKAPDKTKSDLDDMSNLGSKKRRPASKAPVKRKLEKTEEPTKKKTRSRRQ